MDVASWTTVARDYAAEAAEARVPRSDAQDQHPLLPSSSRRHTQGGLGAGAPAASADPLSAAAAAPVADDPLSGALAASPSSSRTRVNSAKDPLSMMLAAGTDPLSAPAPTDPLSGAMSGGASLGGAEPLSSPSSSGAAAEDAQGPSGASTGEPSALAVDSWEFKKKAILREYTVSGNMKVIASFMNDAGGGDDGESQQGTKSVDRSKARLMQLENPGGRTEDTLEVSQKQYTARIETLHADLNRAWGRDEKVHALKIAIQCAKMLGDTDVPTFYPSMFVLLTDILDTFGNLVFTRIKNKAEEADNAGNPAIKVPRGFTANDVSVDAKETCRNWFYKTACIRELLPRLYIEIALLRCYRFLSDQEYPRLLGRLGSIIRGIGNPMVALYARCYLVRNGAFVYSDIQAANGAKVGDKGYATTMLYDYLFSFRELNEHERAQRVLGNSGLTMAEYLHLHSPAVDWIVKYVGAGASLEVFTAVLQRYNDFCKSSMVLRHIIDSFDPSLYSDKAVALVALIKQATPSKTTLVTLLDSVGRQFCVSPPPPPQRLVLLNEVWKVVTHCRELNDYVSCAATWLDVLLQHYSDREVLILLQDVTAHMEQADVAAVDEVAPMLESLVNVLITHCKSFGGSLMTSEHLAKLLDCFKQTRKVEMCKDLLDSFAKNQSPTNNPILINTLFDLARTLHDSLDSLSPDGETRHIATLICNIVGKIDFKKDLEQQLNMYVECRAAFPNLDAVKDRLILAVANLATKAHFIMKGRHTKKTSAFVKACLAYCHVTIPSIDDLFRRLELMLHCAQVALLNQCLPQTDTFLKATISLLPEAPPTEEVDYKRVSTEARLATFLQSFLSFLVVVPGHPQHGPFYLVQGLLNALPRYEWTADSQLRTSVYIDMLPLLCAYGQRRLPYSIERVESNDVLYGGSAEYLAELQEHRGTVMQEIIAQLTALRESSAAGAKSKQAELVLRLVNRLLQSVEMDLAVGGFVAKLMDLAAKNRALLPKSTNDLFDRTVQHMRRRADVLAQSNTSADQAQAFQTLIRAVTS